MSSPTRPSFFLTLLFSVCIISCKCEQVVVPPTDTSPPSVAMFAAIGDKSDIVTSAPVNETVNLPNATVTMLGIGQDADGGVQNVQIEGDVDTFCTNGTLGQTQSGYFNVNNPDSSKPGSQACVTRLVGLNVQLSEWHKCNPGFSYVGTAGSFTFTGTNFSGGSTKTGLYTFSTGSTSQLRQKKESATQNTCKARLKKVRGLRKTSCTETALPSNSSQ